MEERLLVSTSPHVRGDESIPKIMWTVVIALAPAAIAGCWFFGGRAIGIILGSIAVAVATGVSPDPYNITREEPSQLGV